jgi:hypothetical protein
LTTRQQQLREELVAVNHQLACVRWYLSGEP